MVFFGGKEADFALLLQVRPRKTFRIKERSEKPQQTSRYLPETGRSQVMDLEIKTDPNPPITNYKP